MNPNYQVTWLRIRPSFTIECTRSTSTNRGYHETHYEVVSEHELDADDVRRLDDCGLLGSGQTLHMLKYETFEDEVPPEVVDRRTGKRVECDCGHTGVYKHKETCSSIPYGHNGQPFTATTKYLYHRYDFLRICDSGD